MWEYECINLKSQMSLEDFQSKLNKKGSQGWELVGTEHLAKVNGQIPFLIFKRPIGHLTTDNNTD
jgi:hypothetical protein